MKFRKGQVLTIYQDPITQTKPEGEAKLIHPHYACDDQTEYWEVEFQEEPGVTYNRIIKISQSPKS